MQHPPILIVDEQDKEIGSATMNEAHEQDLIHRIVYIVAEDGEGRVLLQKRNSKVVIYPGRWDTAAAGHVDAGDGYEAAAHKELREELGIDDAELQEIGYYRSKVMFGRRHLNRFNKVYKLVVPKDIILKLERDEVARVKWLTKRELQQLITTRPEQVTTGLSEAFKRYLCK